MAELALNNNHSIFACDSSEMCLVLRHSIFDFASFYDFSIGFCSAKVVFFVFQFITS